MIKKVKHIRFGLCFDDVLLIPGISGIASRKLVDVSTKLADKITLRIPLISASVPWCTEWRMAAMMAQLGGLGIVHRMMTPQRQAQEVARVKSVEFSRSEFPNAIVDKSGRLTVGAAVGVKDDYLARARLLVKRGADLLSVDIAHGHSRQAIGAIKIIKKECPKVGLLAGNVATSKGTVDLIRAGADAVKIGIGPGGICSTRIVTGCGVPQLSAILECVEYAAESDTPIVADGGIRAPGDITKALAAGASCVMLGSMLAGAEESSALTVTRGSSKYKVTTGFVTLGMQLTLKRANNLPITETELSEYVPEGVEATFPFTGPLQETVAVYVGGLKSGMSYCGAESIPQLWRRGQFIQISPAGFAEGTPHALRRSEQVHPDYKQRFLAEAVQHAGVGAKSSGQIPSATGKNAN